MNKFQAFTRLAAGSVALAAGYSGTVCAAVNTAATEIPAIIVSAARTEQSSLTTPASITVITRQQIDDSGASHVVEVLRGQGGVQVNDLYGDGSRARIDMRGFGDAALSNTMIMIDGRRLNNPDMAAPELNSIALDDIERIEIVQGSAGVLFGDQAVGGVVNIITRKPDALQHDLKISAGSYNTRSLHGSTSQLLDNGVNYRVSLDLRESDNYRDHNEISYANGFAKLGYEHDNGSVFAELQYIDDELNTPGALFADEVADNRRQVAARYAKDFSDSETRVGRLGMVQEVSNDWTLQGELTSRNTDGKFLLTAVPGIQQREIVEFTPRFIGFIPAMNNTLLTIGVDIIESDYAISTSFGDQYNDQSQRSVYMQAVVPASAMLDVTVGIRHAEVGNDLRDTGSFAVYPAGIKIDDDVTIGTLGLAVKVDNSWRVLLRADQNYRFAKVDELLAPGLTATYDPIVLKTQKGVSLETGVEWASRANSAKLIIYRLELDNEIAYDPTVDPFGANINLDKTSRQGLIASGYWQVTPQLDFTASYTFTDAEVTDGNFAGKDIPLVAEHSAMLTTGYTLSGYWRVFGEVIAKGERVTGGDFSNELSKLPGYGVLNLIIVYSIKDFNLSCRVNNVLNKEYSDVGELGYKPYPVPSEAFFPSPEINFLLTAAWAFR